ncbi:MAG: hypothetical protein RBU45_15355, partial [Myxococcota bacterium]|nr:hypothetical protein [Myxococcota bacterium]
MSSATDPRSWSWPVARVGILVLSTVIAGCSLIVDPPGGRGEEGEGTEGEGEGTEGEGEGAEGEGEGAEGEGEGAEGEGEGAEGEGEGA